MTGKETPPPGLDIGQRGGSEFLVRTGANSGRIVDTGTGAIDTVPDFGSALAAGDWEPVSDPDGASAALRLVAEAEARWRERAGGGIGGIDFDGGDNDGI